MVATLLRYSIGGPFVECKKPVDAQELAYCLATQTCRDLPLCPPEFETLVSTGLLPDVFRLSKEDTTNLNCKGYLAIELDTIVDDLSIALDTIVDDLSIALDTIVDDL